MLLLLSSQLQLSSWSSRLSCSALLWYIVFVNAKHPYYVYIYTIYRVDCGGKHDDCTTVSQTSFSSFYITLISIIYFHGRCYHDCFFLIIMTNGHEYSTVPWYYHSNGLLASNGHNTIMYLGSGLMAIICIRLYRSGLKARMPFGKSLMAKFLAIVTF